MTHTIKIGATEIPVAFGNATLVAFEQETGISLIAGELTLNYGDTLKLAFCAARNGARREKKAFDMTFEDFCDLLDDDPNALTGIMDLFAQAMPQPNGEKKTTKKVNR